LDVADKTRGDHVQSYYHEKCLKWHKLHASNNDDNDDGDNNNQPSIVDSYFVLVLYYFAPLRDAKYCD